MLIYHIDRNGGRWVFNVPDCTKAQAGAFARVLRDISRINIRRRGLSYKQTPTEQANAEFCERMERAILDQLVARFPVPPEENKNPEYFAL